MDLDLLSQRLADAGEPAYRREQAWEWQARGARDWEERHTDRRPSR